MYFVYRNKNILQFLGTKQRFINTQTWKKFHSQ